MNPKDRQKMCSSCDGRIPFDANLCPYCAAEQKGGALPAENSAKQQHHQSLQDSLTALYTPPYATKSTSLKEFSHPQKREPLSEPMAEKRFTSPSFGAPTIPTSGTEEQSAVEDRSSFWPILFLSIGANLLTLGLIQLFFSDEGFLRLEWSSRYWFVYCLAAFPLFFLGFKKVNAVKG
jgi:hypothetical protein